VSALYILYHLWYLCLKYYLFQYINCFGNVSTSVFFSTLLIVKYTWWWPKMAETCSRWWLCSVLKVVFALMMNTDIDFSYIFHQRTKVSLVLRPSNVNISAKQIWAYPKPFSSRSSRPIFWVVSLFLQQTWLPFHPQ
jgi:hypothetical protein